MCSLTFHTIMRNDSKTRVKVSETRYVYPTTKLDLDVMMIA